MKRNLKNIALWNRISAIDMGPIAFKLRAQHDGLNWSMKKVFHEINNYRMFLYLNGEFTKEKIVPTRDIDAVWHHHILDTMKYSDDCNKMFGYFLHHFPYFGSRSDADKADMIDAHQRSKSLFLDEFGVEMGERVGSDPSVCGGGSECFATCDRGSGNHEIQLNPSNVNEHFARPTLTIN